MRTTWDHAPSRRRAIPWTVAILVLASTVSMITFMEVHQHQQKHDPAKSIVYSMDDLVDDEQEMDETLKSLGDLMDGDDVRTTIDFGEGEEGQDLNGISSSDETCHPNPHSEYDGEKVVIWGANNIVESAADCCASCTVNADCNIWVFCPESGGCDGHKFGECWLKQADMKKIIDYESLASTGTPWLSGSIYTQASRDRIEQEEKKRLSELMQDPDLPIVYLDIAIKGAPIGRIKIVLFTKDSPLAAENFRALCTGEKGTVPTGHEGAGKNYHFKGASFYRIVDRFINQSGANTDSTYGGQFKDDLGGLALKHDRKGLLSMANAGPDTNTSHFSILMAPAPHLDAHYTIFGEIVEGLEVAERINALARDKPDKTAGIDEQAVIVDSGQIR